MVQPRTPLQSDDEAAISREVERIKARKMLEDYAAKIGGPGTRVADPDKFTQFLAAADAQHKAQGGEGLPPPPGFVDRVRGAVGDAFRRPETPPDAGIVDRLLPGFRGLSIPTLPESVETRAPEALRPAARVVRQVSSPLGLATLPLGGSARVVGGGLLGAAGGATAGQAVGGDTGELIGALGGGVVGGIPAVQRLAGRGATAAGRGAVRAGDEAALRLQGRQVAHAATEGVETSSGPLARMRRCVAHVCVCVHACIGISFPRTIRTMEQLH